MVVLCINCFVNKPHQRIYIFSVLNKSKFVTIERKAETKDC